MAKPCAVFWDIQNFDSIDGQSVDSIAHLIRSNIIKSYNLNEIFFFCVYDAHKLPSYVGQSSANLDFQTYNGIKDSAHDKIMELMRKFVKVAGQDCTIILLSGDADYYSTLSDLKNLQNVSIHLIRLANSFSPKLDQISDYTFMLNNGVLKLVKSTGNPMYFISIKSYPHTMESQVVNELNAKAIGSIGNSAILYSKSICIGFSNRWNTENAIEQLDGLRFRGIIFKAELLVDSPLTDILKCIKPDVTMETKSDNEVKQLTFIKMSNSNEVDIITFSEQFRSQCILSRESYLWIVFLFKSDAQDCLSKVQIMYPDAVISEPPIDLTSKCPENPYTVQSCRQKGTNEGPVSVVSIDGHGDYDWKLFFRYNSDLIAPASNYEPTKWSLLYNMFEKLYDLGAKKVIFYGNLYCAHFNSVSDYRDASKKIIDNNDFKRLFMKHECATETHKQEVERMMKQHEAGMPWCLTEELDLHCIVVKVDAMIPEFKEDYKIILGNRECIFIKSIPGEIWIGFPDEHLCKNSEKTVKGFLASLKQQNDMSIAKPSKELLESINLQDLAGDAYDLAFLSSQLEDLEPSKRPNILKQIRLHRMQDQECNESFFSFVVYNTNIDFFTSYKMLPEKIVKIFVNFSKVIPLAVAKSSYKDYDLLLIYNSWHEANAARHFIAKLTLAKFPDLRAPWNFYKYLGDVDEEQSLHRKYIEYYIINDQRKVLEKIVQNKNPVEKLDSNSSTVKSTADIDVSDQEVVKKLKYLFVITTNSEFEFTSGMITAIKLKLVEQKSTVCIEFEGKIWAAFDNEGNGESAKSAIEYIKFKLLHDNDEDDFEVGFSMKPTKESPSKVTKMLANKLMSSKKSSGIKYLEVCPLGHFNYNYRKAVGMSTTEYVLFNNSHVK